MTRAPFRCRICNPAFLTIPIDSVLIRERGAYSLFRWPDGSFHDVRKVLPPGFSSRRGKLAGHTRHANKGINKVGCPFCFPPQTDTAHSKERTNVTEKAR